MTRRSVWALAAVCVVLGVPLLALYPTLVLLLAALATIAALTRSRPAAAFLLAAGLFALEGTIKVRLTVEGVPHSLSIGAAAIDAGFLLALAGLLSWVRAAPLKELWRKAGTAERTGLALVAAWLVLSVIQIPVGGDPLSGLKGFRLSQAYVAAGMVGGIMFWALAPRRWAIRVALAGIGLVSAYGVLRVATGPSGSEQAFAVASGIPQEFGTAFRAIGSFSGAFGLASFLVPGAVLSFAVALTSPRDRLLALAAFGLAVVAVVGSLVRAGLVATAAGLLVVTLLLLLDPRLGRRPKLAVSGSLLVIAVLATGAVVLSGGLSGQVQERVKGIVSPGSDESAQIRARTWRQTLREVRKQPLGAGLGTVGRATGGAGGLGSNAAGGVTVGTQKAAYTDNSFLKLLREQGFEGLALFLGGVLTLLGVLAVKLVRAGPARHPVALGALGAVTAYLVLFVFAEYIEQPGKVLVWTLLGIALWDLRRGVAPPDAPPGPGPRARLTARWAAASPRARAGTVAIVLVLGVGPPALALWRSSSYRAGVLVRPAPVQSPARFRALFPLGASGTYVSRILGTSATRVGIASGVDFLLSADQVGPRLSLRERPGPDATVSARADTPARARTLARVTGLQVVAASSREVGRAAAALPPRQRRTRYVRRVTANPPSRIYPARSRPPAVYGLDSAIDRLPGPFPPRPSLLYLLLAGLALGTGLAWTTLAASSRPPQSPSRL